MRQGSQKDPPVEKPFLCLKIVARRVDFGNHYGLENGSNSVQKIDARKVEKMTSKWIQNNEQMIPERMQQIMHFMEM